MSITGCLSQLQDTIYTEFGKGILSTVEDFNRTEYDNTVLLIEIS